MIVDMATGTLLVPTHTAPGISPIPSVVPSVPEYQKAGAFGHRTLWIVFVLMLLSSVVFTGMAWTVPVQKRFFHVLTTMIVVFASLSYFAMATGHGVSYNHIVERESHKHLPDTNHDVYREVYWARYVDWSITTPLLLIDLAVLAGLNGAEMFVTIVADVIMILTGLFAAFGSEGTPQKWGWYTIACLAFLVVIYNLAVHGRQSASAKSDKVGGFFTAIAGFTLVIWTLYPIVWGIADGSRNMSVDAEIFCYAVLDFLAKPVFGAWLLITHNNLPEAQTDLGGFWANGLSREGQIRVGDDDEGA